jgi:hypothetical protein
MLRFDARERNDPVAGMHDAVHAALQVDQRLAFAPRAVGRARRRAIAESFSPIGDSS